MCAGSWESLPLSTSGPSSRSASSRFDQRAAPEVLFRDLDLFLGHNPVQYPVRAKLDRSVLVAGLGRGDQHIVSLRLRGQRDVSTGGVGLGGGVGVEKQDGLRVVPSDRIVAP